MNEKFHPVSTQHYLSRETESRMNWPDGDENIIFHPLCAEVLRKKLRANLEELAIATGEALASTKDMIRCVARNSNQLAPELAKEILAALHHAQTVIEAIGTGPLAASEEDLDKLQETARLLHNLKHDTAH